MAKIKNPLQFSRYFSIEQSRLSTLGVFDPTLLARWARKVKEYGK